MRSTPFVEPLPPSTELRGARVSAGDPVGDRVRRHLARAQREQHSRGVQRIEKPERVADQHPAVARDRRGPVRVVARGEKPRHARRARDPVLHGRGSDRLPRCRSARGSRRGPCPPVAATPLEQVVERCHDADADDVVVQRDVPEPAVFGRRLQDHRGPLVAPRVAIRALPVRPDRALVEHRIPQPELQPVLQERRLAARVDDDARADLALSAARRAPGRSRRRWRDRRRTGPRGRARLRARRRRARARSRASSDRTRCARPARSASTRAACCPRSRTAPTASRSR